MSTIDEAAAAPDARLRALDPLVGSWTITGDATGESTYEWMSGGHFLLQRGVLTHDGRTHEFLEVIGFERGFDAASPAEDITSRVFTTTGDTLDYVYEPGEETLTIWGGAKGSPAVYRGRWENGRQVLRGAWEWPGGGYATVSERAPDGWVPARPHCFAP